MCGLPALYRLRLILVYRLHEFQHKADQPQAEPGINFILYQGDRILSSLSQRLISLRLNLLYRLRELQLKADQPLAEPGK